MKIDNIEIFCVLAETLNYTNAANRLFMTQSALTRAIQQMEEELGFQLFDRSRRSVSLTPAGYSLYEDSRDILDRYYSIVEKARNAKDGYTGTIKFATHLFRVNAVELDIIHEFQKQYPHIYLDICSKHSNEMVYSLNEGFIDCAIGTGRSADKNIKHIVLEHFRDCIVVAPNHQLADREEISFEELKNERFTVISQSYAGRGYDVIKGKARQAGFDPFIEETAQSVPHLLAILSTGKSITVLSDNYKDLAMGKLKFVPLANESVVELAFMWKDSGNNPCVKLLADFIMKNYSIDREGNV